MDLKKAVMERGMKLMSDPRVMKLMADERVMKAVMQMMNVPGKVQSFTDEQIAKLWLAARGWARNPRESRFWMQTLVAAHQDGARWPRTVALNWFYLIGSLQRWSGVSGVHVFDQGLLQALWSILFLAIQPSFFQSPGSMTSSSATASSS